MSWQIEHATEIGGRAEQQDRVEVFAVPGANDGYLVVLADGMGGHAQGALAAQQVVDTARQMLPGIRAVPPRRFLNDLCLSAHAAIRALGRCSQSNPATTCTALYVAGDEAYWVHVGDSRLCQFSAGDPVTCTVDHSLADLLRTGTAGPAQNTSMRTADHRLYMCLGGDNPVEPEYGATAVGADDWFVLATDGFWNLIDAAEFAHRVAAAPERAVSAAELVQIALARGGDGCDNLSLALVRRGPAAPKPWWRF